MKKTARVLALAIATVLTIAVFASCGAQSSGKITNVTMTITAGDTVILDHVPVAVDSDEPTVLLAFQQAADDDNDFPEVGYNTDDDGNILDVTDIGEYVDSADRYWQFRVNDLSFDEIRGRASTYTIKEGDAIYFEYGASADNDGE